MDFNELGLQRKLEELHNDASKDYLRMKKVMTLSVFRPMQPIDFKDAYLPISREQGLYLKELILNHNLQSIVEFGTSFGISTIYLADGVRQTGGKVITTEILECKMSQAKENLKDAQLDQYVEFRTGDAMKTLQNLESSIDLLFLDGWKDLYLPLFHMLEPKFHNNTIIYADNMDMAGTEKYAQSIISNNHYSTIRVNGGKAFLTKKA